MAYRFIDELLAPKYKFLEPKDWKKTDPSEYDRESEAFKAKYGPTSGMSGWGKAAAGVASTVGDLGFGLKQRGMEAVEALTPFDTLAHRAAGSELPSERLRKEEIDRRAQWQPVRETPEGMAGSIGGGLLLAGPASAIPGLNTELGATLFGGMWGASQPRAPGESLLDAQTTAGALAGNAGKLVGDKVGGWLASRHPQPQPQLPNMQQSINIGPSSASSQVGVGAAPVVAARGGGSTFGTVGADASKGLTLAQQQALEAGERIGMKVTPGQGTGSRALQQFEAKAESQPWSSGPFNAIKRHNEQRVASLFLREIGESGDDVTGEVLGAAEQRIGSVFEDAAKHNRINYDANLEAGLADIEARAVAELGGSEFGIVRKQLERVLDMGSREGGQLSGQQFQNLRMGLNRLITGSKPELAYWARQIRTQLDDALLRSVPEEQAQALVQARHQWSVLETALGRQGAVNAQSGKISAATLANSFAQSDRAGFIFGNDTSDLYTALRFTKAFPSIVGDSGTATRSSVNGVLELVAKAPVWAASKAYASGPSVTAAQGLLNAGRQVGQVAGMLGEGAAPYVPGYATGYGPMALNIWNQR